MFAARLVLFLITIIALSAPASAADDSYQDISSSSLRQLMRQARPGLVVIDTRVPQEYREAHLPTAVNMPWIQMERDPAMLNLPKDAMLVFYCSGST